MTTISLLHMNRAGRSVHWCDLMINLTHILHAVYKSLDAL
jgi:hypothetical protein